MGHGRHRRPLGLRRRHERPGPAGPGAFVPAAQHHRRELVLTRPAPATAQRRHQLAGPFRAGDVISTSVVPAWGDADGHAGVVWADSDTSKISLYQGDELLGEDVNERIVTVENVSPDPLPYRMVVEGKRSLPDRPYSTRTRTEWGFTSSTKDYAVLTPLPLVQLDYAVATDLSGKAHRRTGLTVTPSHLKGAAGAGAIRTATVEVSYDDGVTWRRTTLRQSGGAWKAQLDAPSRARFASLRTTARDTKGNSVSQTVIRAFGLK